MQRFITALVTMVAITLGVGAVAHAYPPGPPSVVVVGTPQEGGSANVVVSDCITGENVTFNLVGEASQTVVCGADNTATATFTTLSKGPHTGTAVLDQSGVTLNYTITVTGRTGLPATGSSSTFPTTALALTVVLLGVALFAVARIRRRTAHA